MDNAQKVRAVIRGSAEMDRMKKEIEQVVHMVLGMLSRESRTLPHGSVQLSIRVHDSSKCIWDMYILKYRDVGARCEIPIVSKVTSWTTGFTCVGGRSPISAKHAQRVHDCLPEFLEGMVKAFPEIEERLQPFLDAGKE